MKNFSASFIAIALFSWFVSINVATAQYTIPEKLEWWYEARFGMFIHFGSYSYLGHGEWAFYVESWNKTDYQSEVSANFNPTSFDASEIVGLAKTAGMKYLVITAKHHEGYCMWHTAVESFKDVSGKVGYNLYDFSGFQRDVLKELKDECDAQGIKFCLYYSIIDWNHSSQSAANYFSVMSSLQARTDYISDMKLQLEELITAYHPAVLWFDGDWCENKDPITLSDWWNKNDAKDLYDFVVGLDSNIIVNERVKRDCGLGDFLCPEQTVPSAPMSKQWETCQTMNYAWGYDTEKESSYKTSEALIQELVKVVSRDGNYLLNIGPKGDGSVTDGATTVLKGFGEWMKIYSESIYGTTRSPFSSEPSWGFYTKKENMLYAHVFKWPTNDILQIPVIKNKINRIYLLNDTLTSLSYSIDNNYINITLPQTAPNATNSVVAVKVNGLPVAGSPFDISNMIFSEDIALYPNPAKGKIYLTIDNQKEIAAIIISDLSGKILMERNLQEFQVENGSIEINIEKLVKGYYILKYRVNREEINLPFIKE